MLQVNCNWAGNSMRGLLWVGCAVLAAPAWASSAAPLPPAADLALARDMLKSLVEINTTHAHGSTQAAKAIQGWLLSAGFAPDDAQFLAPAEHPDKGNVVARYRGKRPNNAILFLGHLDVVEAKAEDWSVDPFKLTEQDGWFYGRGTIDMKDGDAALVESLIRLKREKFIPAHDLIVAFTADEEAGSDSNGPAFLLQDHRDLIEAAMVINLDGGGGVLCPDPITPFIGLPPGSAGWRH
jgi:acetylornithine deacetylase/succinyl-diaminopimelate desuccinylase-like protein